MATGRAMTTRHCWQRLGAFGSQRQSAQRWARLTARRSSSGSSSRAQPLQMACSTCGEVFRFLGRQQHQIPTKNQQSGRCIDIGSLHVQGGIRIRHDCNAIHS